MNLNYEAYIKQEFLNEEDEMLNTIFPNTDFNIFVKNEPISDELTSLVTIKNEPLSEITFTEATVNIKNENPVQNQVSIPGNNFIVYELGTSTTTQDRRQVKKTSKPRQLINDAISPYVEFNTSQTITQTSQNIANQNISVVIRPQPNLISNSFTINPPTVVAPPVLLNAQLRKRNKIVVHTNPIDKRARYNIESAKASINAIQPTLTSKPSGVGGKKIINHLIKNKRSQRKLEDETVIVGKQYENENSTREAVLVQNKTLLLELNKERCESVTENQINLNTNKISTPQFHRTVNSNAFCSLTTTTQALSEDSNTGKEVLNAPELRVKCLCSLTADTINNGSNNLELREFFKEMFEKTRRLNKKQQRTVRMTLLQTILDAEEAVEKGKCCGF